MEVRRELSASVLEDAVGLDSIETAESTTSPDAPAPSTVEGILAHLVILGSVALPMMALVLCFSVMGYGDVTYIGLSAWQWPWYAAAGIDAGLVVVLWTFDVTSWRRRALIHLRRLCVLGFVLVAGIACLLATKVHPLAPLLFGLLLVPACVLCARHSMLRTLEPSAYMHSLSLSLSVSAALLLLHFILWVTVLPPPPRRLASGWDPSWMNVWSLPVRDYWRHRLECDPFNATAVRQDVECYDAAFLWWCFPVLLSGALFLAGAACRFLSRVVATEGVSAEAGAIKLFVLVLAFAAVGLYVAASIAGAGMGLSDFVIDGTLFLVASAVVMVGVTLGWARFMQAVSEQAWVQRALTYMQLMHEWCIALVLCVGTLPIAAYLVASWLKQLTRKARGAQRLQSEQAGAMLTAEAMARLKQLKDVPWGSVCAKVAILNLCYLTLSVIVAKLVVVFLSGLTLALSAVPVFTVLLIFLLVGIAMFLIPVIPGVPVYICAGVLIPSAMMSEAERVDTTSTAAPASWTSGLLLASALASFLKFVAIALQQEVIGKRLGRRIGVRAACQINSTFIRAARFVLTQPGCNFGKTMILCGGPDWPTSVLTGILDLSVVKMLIGSIPVIIIILPCCALGACLIMANRPGWDNVTELFTFLAGASQLAASVGFAAVIERAVATHYDAIAALPYDEEVRALDERQAEYASAWREAADWRHGGHPTLARYALASAAVMSTIGCHLATILRCFERVTVADPFDKAPLHGNPLNVVYGAQGWIVMACFLLASLVLYLHHMWLAAQARQLMPAPRLPGPGMASGMAVGEPWGDRHSAPHHGGGLPGSNLHGQAADLPPGALPRRLTLGLTHQGL